MIEMAQRIVSDGTQHFSRFLDIQSAFKIYADVNPPPYLRTIQEGKPKQTSKARKKLKAIIALIHAAYSDEGHGDYAHSGKDIVAARTAMNELLDIGESLASDKGLGIPFFAFLDPSA